MTSKSKIAEQILRRLAKYSDEASVDERELMLSIHQSLATILRKSIIQTYLHPQYHYLMELI